MIRILETDEDKNKIVSLIESRNTFQYRQITPEQKRYIVEMTFKSAYTPGVEIYGDFDVYDQLNAVIFFNKWWNYDGLYSMGVYASREGIPYPKTYDGVNQDIRIDLINFAVANLQSQGYHTCYNMTPDNNKLIRASDNVNCILSTYEKEFVRYVEIGESFEVGMEPTGGGLLLNWKRENPLSYLVPYPMNQRQKIIKLTKKEV